MDKSQLKNVLTFFIKPHGKRKLRVIADRGDNFNRK